MSDKSIAISGVLLSILIACVLRYWIEDCIERDAAALKITGFELIAWIKRRTG